ncbi:MAG: hypothetical protein OQK95_04265 [Gammaproteobacteria bacterium]|nr:hypothetical protein [Gammaproteobacteria bacterium]MCW9030566.1 hypothetical protein [Gammaproteobacteria bacterium]
MNFFEELEEQRWDDHRYYHHSRINQSLHFLSAICFLCSYVLLFINPIAAAFFGWILAMTLRQSGHFFFEPLDYDEINQATHEHKENIKVGYNLRRKVVLISIWFATPFILFLFPDLFGTLNPHSDTYDFVYNLSILWIVLGAAALIFRTVHLFFIKDVRSGLVWFTKILTDPFHDIKIYHKSPWYLFKGELMDPMQHIKTTH